MEDIRFLMCNVKTLNLIPSVLAYERCTEAGCQETVFHRGDRVTECAHSNILMLKDGVLCTQAVELDDEPVGGRDPKNLKTLQDAYAAYYAEDTK